jgi:potassium-transporting ATPase KdpC subunit
MKRNLLISCLYTIVTTIILGLGYPYLMTGVAQIFFKDKANGQLIVSNGHVIGSRIIGQPFTGPGNFHSRPSAAGTGYDASNSSGSNLGPTSKALVDRVTQSVAAEKSAVPVPIDLMTTSASGLDPDITPAAALYQVPRVARERHLTEAQVAALVNSHIQARQLGLLGEPRVNVLQLNLDLAGMK